MTTIRRLDTPAAAAAAAALITEVWQHELMTANLLRALDHTGSYVYGVGDGDDLVAAAVAFLGRDGDVPTLHSHIAAVRAGHRGAGLGLAMKRHQREWALARGIGVVTWTFDPLVRRNAYFNIAKLGALPARYLVDFYGPMDDRINRGDETDRLYVEWRLSDPPPDPATATESVAVPDDVEALRASDPEAARRWRYDVRAALGGALASGATVVGFDRERGYLLAR